MLKFHRKAKVSNCKRTFKWPQHTMTNLEEDEDGEDEGETGEGPEVGGSDVQVVRAGCDVGAQHRQDQQDVGSRGQRPPHHPPRLHLPAVAKSLYYRVKGYCKG